MSHFSLARPRDGDTKKFQSKKKQRCKSAESSSSSSSDATSPILINLHQKFTCDGELTSKVIGETSCRKQEDISASYVAVAAIDFGTTYSGYAYAFTRDPDNVHLMNQRATGHYRSGYGFQQPTVLLLNRRGELHSFGYEAQDFYHDLDERDSNNFLFFEKFKMELHSRQHLNERMELEATNGFKLPALHVFAEALRYFTTQCVEEINNHSSSVVSPSDIKWVVTVPAIWRPSAKQFMRRAAVEAGMITCHNPNQLVIALEPEAASVYCRKLQLRECIPRSRSSPSPSTGAPKYIISSSSTSSSPSPPQSMYMVQSVPLTPPESLSKKSKYAADIQLGMKYLVADCGGGTVDLTIHQVESNGLLRELFKATGGAWGSIGVDCQFELLLVSIFGEQFIENFARHRAVSWLELMNNFEAKKRAFNPKMQNSSSITLPFAFIDQFQRTTMKSVASVVSAYKDKYIQWSDQGSLRLQAPAMMRLFEPVVNSVVQQIKMILCQPEVSSIEYLFLVGGFAESPVLQLAIRESFEGQLTIIIPQDVSLTILKGAVMFGMNPSAIHIRRSGHTFGVACLNKFDPEVHPPNKKVIKDGKEWCTEIFDKFVTIGEAIPHGHIITRSYNLARSNIKTIVFSLFATDNEYTRFVTDPGVLKIGELKLDSPDISRGKSRELKMTLMFGNTEISVQAVDCTSGQTASANVNFLFH